MPQTLSVYLIGATRELARARRWADELDAAGIEVVSTWPAVVEAAGIANPRNVPRDVRVGISITNLDELHRAKIAWFLVPGVNSPTCGGWYELGYSAATAKPLYCSGDTQQSSYSALAYEYASDEEAFAAILRLDGGRIQ